MASAEFDLEPLISTSRTTTNGLPRKNNRRPLTRRSSGTFASLRRYRCLMISLVLFLILLGLGILYNCPEDFCLSARPQLNDHPPPAPLQIDVNFVDYETIQHDNFEFHLNGSDVMVFLHIQKTGGTTFGKHLVQDIDLEEPCLCNRRPGRKKKKKMHRHRRDLEESDHDRTKRKLHCDCFRPESRGSTWLFSRYSTGWKCGLHPDFTELTECVDNYLDATERSLTRRYFYITFLRDPVQRFLSEFKHVQRGATWKAAQHRCNGVPATRQELPPCYDDLRNDDWSGVSLEEFMNCPHNLAINRQTRMLADLRLVNCYNTSFMSNKRREMVLLNSAKNNLEKMAFFGLTEQQKASQFMFQYTFDMNFKRPFEQHDESRSSAARLGLDQDIIDQITEMNHLDVELYEFAKNLMERRYEEAKKNAAANAVNPTISTTPVTNTINGPPSNF